RITEVPEDLKTIFMEKQFLPGWDSPKKKGQRRASGQPIKHWGKVADCQVDFNKFAPAQRAKRRSRPLRIFADNQMSQYIFIGNGVPSLKSR
ncbi:MAG: hypothetical protein VX704_05760, partial [Verrucomicrobiota bacterium]|nr:hypothetical protein [Verrucomicrobiota bacterium]